MWVFSSNRHSACGVALPLSPVYGGEVCGELTSEQEVGAHLSLTTGRPLTTQGRLSPHHHMDPLCPGRCGGFAENPAVTGSSAKAWAAGGHSLPARTKEG